MIIIEKEMNVKFQNGFTLIEMIGVMAIIAIIAATITPNLLRDIDRAVAETEQDNLANLANELEIYIRNNKIIPSAANWASAISSISSNKLDNVERNTRFYNRRYYVDPRFFTTSDTNFSQYSQSTGLNTAPNSPRIIIASNLKADLPSTLSSSSAFNAVWDQTLGASIVEGPDIKIERINLTNIFHRIILGNDNASTQPAYQLETSGLNSISTTGAEFHVITDTKINLYQAPFTSNVIEKVFIADRSKNFSYEFDGVNWSWDKL